MATRAKGRSISKRGRALELRRTKRQEKFLKRRPVLFKRIKPLREQAKKVMQQKQLRRDFDEYSGKLARGEIKNINEVPANVRPLFKFAKYQKDIESKIAPEIEKARQNYDSVKATFDSKYQDLRDWRDNALGKADTTEERDSIKENYSKEYLDLRKRYKPKIEFYDEQKKRYSEQLAKVKSGELLSFKGVKSYVKAYSDFEEKNEEIKYKNLQVEARNEAIAQARTERSNYLREWQQANPTEKLIVDPTTLEVTGVQSGALGQTVSQEEYSRAFRDVKKKDDLVGMDEQQFEASTGIKASQLAPKTLEVETQQAKVEDDRNFLQKVFGSRKKEDINIVNASNINDIGIPGVDYSRDNMANRVSGGSGAVQPPRDNFISRILGFVKSNSKQEEGKEKAEQISTQGVVSAVQEPEGFFPKISQDISFEQARLETKSLREKDSLLTGAKQTGLSVVSVPVDILAFGEDVLTRPKETVGGIYKGVKGLATDPTQRMILGEQIKGGGGRLEQRPDLLIKELVQIPLEASVATKGLGKISKAGQKGIRKVSGVPEFNIIDDVLDVPLSKGKSRLKITELGDITEPISEQAISQVGKVVEPVSAQRGLFGRGVSQVEIRKPLGVKLSDKGEALLKKFDAGDISPQEILKLDAEIKKVGAKGILERTFFADPKSRIRKSRLGTTGDGDLLDYFTGDVSLGRSKQPQVLTFGKQKIPSFPKSLKTIENKLKSGTPLTKLEQAKLLNYQLKQSGKFKPVGFLSREPEVILPSGTKIKGKRVGFTEVNKNLVDVYEAEILKPAKLEPIKANGMIETGFQPKKTKVVNVESSKLKSEILITEKELLAVSAPISKRASKIKSGIVYNKVTSPIVPSSDISTPPKTYSPKISPSGVTPKKPSKISPGYPTSDIPSGISGVTSGVPSGIGAIKDIPKSPKRRKAIRPRLKKKKPSKPIPDKDLGYNTFVKSGGRYYKTTPRPIRRSNALDNRDFFIDQSTSRQGIVVPTNQRASKPTYKIPKGYSKKVKGKMRTFKQRKGVKKSLRDLQVIEYSRNALDTPSEKRQINLARKMAQTPRRKTAQRNMLSGTEPNIRTPQRRQSQRVSTPKKTPIRKNTRRKNLPVGLSMA